MHVPLRTGVQAAAFRAHNTERLARADADMAAAVARAVALMRKGVDEEIKRLARGNAAARGYPREDLENKLNERYYELEADLKRSVEGGGPAFTTRVAQKFDAKCREMHADVCNLYAEIIDAALAAAEAAAGARLEKELRAVAAAQGPAADDGTLVAVATLRAALAGALSSFLATTLAPRISLSLSVPHQCRLPHAAPSLTPSRSQPPRTASSPRRAPPSPSGPSPTTPSRTPSTPPCAPAPPAPSSRWWPPPRWVLCSSPSHYSFCILLHI